MIYGIPEESWQKIVSEERRCLTHTDGEILAIEITESATSEWIQQTLASLTQTVGIPRQIIADRGSNLKKGIQLYQESNPQVIYTYDVTHGMANLLKKELFSDEHFQLFCSDCHRSRQQLKIFGLNRQSLTQFSQKLSRLEISEILEPFQQKIFTYLKKEIELIQDDRTILATSDILESIFGKYKHFSQRCPLSDLRSMLLTIPLSTMKLTRDVIKQALETVREIDLSQWVNEIFGQSMLSKRQTLFSAANSDMKTV